jgi:hypothetical protein
MFVIFPLSESIKNKIDDIYNLGNCHVCNCFMNLGVYFKSCVLAKIFAGRLG